MGNKLTGSTAGKAFLARGRRLRLISMPAVLGLVGALIVLSPSGPSASAAPAATGCANPVACENQLPGTPPSVWDASQPGPNGPTIQGFADPFSVNLGQTINFKIESVAKSYTIDIYRMGYYGGDGARLITSVTPNIAVSQSQPACNNNTATGLVDCGNWGVSASWTVPSTAVSGVYFAHLARTDGSSDDSQIPFVVTDNASHSQILFKTSDTTWQAYNQWGGNSLYAGNATDTAASGLDPGRAVAVSYNRPFSTRWDTPNGQDFFFANEFPMIQFLEQNGYDVSYISSAGVDSDTGGALMQQHKVLLSVGHDEYWSGGMRTNVEAALKAGTSLGFFSGNTLYWKTRWAPSQFGNEPDRTLITYKESISGAPTDPQDPPTWTGLWRDPRGGAADGARPENGLTGTMTMVIGDTRAIQVPSQFSKLRFWRNTSVARLAAGQVSTLGANTLGYEWEEDLDNGFRPAGLIDMSSTTASVQQIIADKYGDVVPGTATHNLTLYRAPSGALVFGAGTIQWAWGLSANHDGNGGTVSTDMQQATVNVLADMGAQPATLMSGLVAAAASTDHTAPTSAITAPSAGATFNSGSTVTINGTATDSGGGVVAGVEVSTDGGSTWHPVTTMSPANTSVTWSYTWSAAGNGPVTIKSRAADDSGNIETPGAGVSVTVNCPCSLFGNSYVPSIASTTDTGSYELGVKFQSTVPGWVAGVRFYKGTGNTGTHTGTLWTAGGTQLATGTFTNETASGWQTMQFANPVQISANTTYVVSYYDPAGHYSDDQSLFDWALHTPPLVGVQASYVGTTGGNGVFNQGGSAFPTSSYNGSTYAVDVLFDTVEPPGTPPAVSSVTPYPGSSSNPVSVTPTATFTKAVVPSTASVTVTDSHGNAVAGSTSFDSTDKVATFTPTSSLAASTTYSVAISGAQDKFGQTMAPYSYSFITSKASGQCPCSIWPDVTPPGVSDAADTSPVELGVTFKASSNGTVSGIRFYKQPDNTGTHTGSLWTAGGTLLATGTFSNESTEGWQELDFATPVSITAGASYVASYHTTTGHYAVTSGGLGSPVTSGSLTALANGGVYAYGPGGTFPNGTYNAANYWVDVVEQAAPPSVITTSPINGQTSVPTNASASFTFDRAVQASTIQFTLTGPGGVSVPGSVSYNSATNTATFTPTATLLGGSGLSNSTAYTGTVSGAEDASGMAMSGAYSWTFTTAQAGSAPGQCPCSIWSDSTQPSVPSANDSTPVNVGVKFSADQNGWISGIRFYKGAGNTGTHVGSLWDSSGNLLGQVSFTSESSAGWQQATFATPIPVTAGTTYIASYFAPNGNYAYDPAGLGSAVNNPPLHALQSSGPAGQNGVYQYAGASAFPTNSYNATNYWVDIVFTTTAP